MNSPRSARLARGKTILVSVVVVTTTLGVASRIWVAFPTWLHWDENYYVNIAQNYIDRGGLTPHMWRLGDQGIIAGGGSGYGIVLLAEWMRLVGMSLFWGRMLMIFACFAASVVTYKTAILWWNSRVAGISAFVFAIVSTSPFYTLVLRMDSIGILLYSLLLLLHVRAVRLKKRWLHLCVGIAAVVAMEFHILAVLYLIALTVYYAATYIEEVSDKHRLIWSSGAIYFALGVCAAGAGYAMIHILPAPQAYFVIAENCYECNEGLLLTEFKRLYRSLLFRPWEMLMFAVVSVSAVIRRRRRDRHWLLIALGWLGAQAIVGPPPYSHYASHYWPILALGVGGFVAWGFKCRPSQQRVSLCAIVAIGLLEFNVGLHVLGFHPFMLSYELNDSKSVDYVAHRFAEDTVIMASVSTFYSLQDYRNFVAYRDGTVYGTILRGESMLDFWRRVSPEVVMLEEDVVAADNELSQYLAERRFVQIMSDLWATDESGDRRPTDMKPVP